MAALDLSVVQEAVLWSTRDEPVLGRQGGATWGHTVELLVRVVTEMGRALERRQTSFVAAYDHLTSRWSRRAATNATARAKVLARLAAQRQRRCAHQA